MSNMSYCRFNNTYDDLRDCEEHIQDKDLSKEEHNKRERLIRTCYDILNDNNFLTQSGELDEEEIKSLKYDKEDDE